MKTDYAGIDYGLGKANVDAKTGIRYGVISPNSISPDALDDIYQHGENLSYKGFVEAKKDEFKNLINDFLDNTFISRSKESLLESFLSELEENLGENYREDEDTYRYEKDGLIIETTGLGLYVIKSPVYTNAQFCSPCCPGAGNLDAPCDGGPKTYCLPADWFEENKCPYPIYSVETGNIVP